MRGRRRCDRAGSPEQVSLREPNTGLVARGHLSLLFDALGDQNRTDARRALGKGKRERASRRIGGDEPLDVPAGCRSFAGYVALAGKAVVADDTQHDPRFDGWSTPSNPSNGSTIGAPIFGSAGIVGVLIAESATPGTFDHGDAHFIQSMANIIGSVLAG